MRPLGALVLLLLAGCAAQPSAQGPERPLQGSPALSAKDGEGVPAWEAGRWWKVRIRSSFADREEMQGRIVVAGRNGDSYLVGTDALNISLFDRYFDHVYVGPVDKELNPTVGGARVQLFQWPLQANRSWVTPFPTADVEEGKTKLANATLRSHAIEGRDSTQQIRVLGVNTRNEAIDYDVDLASAWLTYLRVTNATTGKILLALDVEAYGIGYKGPVHRLVLTALKERFAILPPCDQRPRCYPEAAGVPHVETVNVPAGFTWIDEVAFLFTFPIVVGGGVAAFQFIHPDGAVDQDIHKGAGDRFQYTLRRYEARNGTAGTWGLGLQVAGTAGAFVGLYGVKDEVTEL